MPVQGAHHIVTADTRVVGVVGNPVRHSLSPVMHNAAFAHDGLDWVYVALPVEDPDATSTLRAAWHLGFEGLSVTMPHKRAAARAAVRRTSTVDDLGVANTLVRASEGWVAHNTDVDGFRRWIEDDLGIDIPRTTFGLLGAGGVAAAVVAALGGAETVVWNRTRERAVGLLGPDRVLDDPGGLERCEVVVSCVPSDAVPDGLRFRRGQVLLDLVYNPSPTPLMEAARRAGADAHDGLALLVHQGALQYEHWTGRKAPLDAMRSALGQGLPAQGP